MVATKRAQNGEGGFYKALRAYKERADRRGYAFELSEDEARELFTGNCAYCGREPAQISVKHPNGRPFVYNGIDRVDNALGYIHGNCVSCCGVCNRAKDTLSRDEFLSLVRAIARNLEL